MNSYYFWLLCYILDCSDVLAVSLTPHEESIITKTFNEIDGYWTDKRVRDAMANPMEVDTTTIKYRADRVRRQAESVWTDEAIRSAVPIEAEAPLEALRELGIYPSESPPLEADLSPKHIVDVDEYPYNNFGKLLVSDSSGSHHCTAAFIRERVLITAAHCVKHANGDWYDHVRFYQRFNGMDDQGRIVEVEKMFVPPRYVDRNGVINLRFDYAFLTTTKSDDVTTLGYDFSGVVPSNEHIYFAGYPADTEEGLKLISSSGLRNPGIRALLHVPQNPLTSGSAGGPWLIRHSDDNYQVIGVASHGQPAQGVPGAFSPVLDAETKRILKAAERAIETVSTPTRESEEQSSETVPSEPDA